MNELNSWEEFEQLFSQNEEGLTNSMELEKVYTTKNSSKHAQQGDNYLEKLSYADDKEGIFSFRLLYASNEPKGAQTPGLFSNFSQEFEIPSPESKLSRFVLPKLCTPHDMILSRRYSLSGNALLKDIIYRKDFILLSSKDVNISLNDISFMELQGILSSSICDWSSSDILLLLRSSPNRIIPDVIMSLLKPILTRMGSGPDEPRSMFSDLPQSSSDIIHLCISRSSCVRLNPEDFKKIMSALDLKSIEGLGISAETELKIALFSLLY